MIKIVAILFEQSINTLGGKSLDIYERHVNGFYLNQ